MKKVNLEDLNNDMFGKFESHKLSSLSKVKGGLQTSTTKCKTDESTFDSDSNSSGEQLNDPSCTGSSGSIYAF